MKDFFISYTGMDRSWAEWIAWTLEKAGFSVVIQAWDFRPGGNFVVEMQKAAAGSDRTIAVLSPDYLRSLYAMSEWAAAFAADPDGAKGKLIPVLVRDAVVEGLLAPIIRINLVSLDEAAAREALLKGLAHGRAKPASVQFPGARPFPGSATAPVYPGEATATLADLPLDEVPKPGPLPAGSRMPLAANPLFVGREEDLKILARQLKEGETSAVGQVEIAVATGLGGIGKTQLASEFVHRYGRFFTGGVFWLSFADAGAIPSEIAACGQGLGLHLSFETLTLEQQVRLVNEAWRGPISRLLVFDNCEDEDLLRHWRPPFGGARVLMTSRRAEWDSTLGVKKVQLTTLPRPASIKLLCLFRPDIPETEPALDEIAGDLGDLPLALHLAGSFLKAYRASRFGQPAVYLESLRQMDLLNHPSLEGRGSGVSPTGHEGHVGRTFALSLERLDPACETDALAVDLLARAAWFSAGEAIPRSLLFKAINVVSEDLTTTLMAEDALGRLSNLGLIEVNDKNDLLMHRLVAAWARGVANFDEAQDAVEQAVLGEARIANETRSPAPLLSWQPHLRTVTDRAVERNVRAAARLYDELGLHLLLAGDYSGARRYLERAVTLHIKVFGTEHLDTAQSLHNLGHVLHRQGDYPAARPYLEQGLGIRERLLRSDHQDIATSLNDLGLLLVDQGNYTEARSYHERALKIREESLDPEHPDTAYSLSNLGHLLQIQGEYEAARPYFERAWANLEKVFGPEHPDTAKSLNNLGSLLQDQGDYEGARPYYERALAIHEKVLGPEHPSTAISLNNLGNLLEVQGNYEGACVCYERSLVINEKVLGPEHPNTAVSLGNLGGLFHRQDDYEKARPYYERALAIHEKVLGPEHPDTARSLSNLGSLLQAQNDYKGALSYCERALVIREKVLGPGHPDTARSLNNLGTLLKDQGNLKGARACHERALTVVKKVLGSDHPDAARYHLNLSNPCFHPGNSARARWHLEQALAIFKARLGSNHPETQDARRHLSMLPGSRQMKKQRSKKKR